MKPSTNVKPVMPQRKPSEIVPSTLLGAHTTRTRPSMLMSQVAPPLPLSTRNTNIQPPRGVPNVICKFRTHLRLNTEGGECSKPRGPNKSLANNSQLFRPAPVAVKVLFQNDVFKTSVGKPRLPFPALKNDFLDQNSKNQPRDVSIDKQIIARKTSSGASEEDALQLQYLSETRASLALPSLTATRFKPSCSSTVRLPQSTCESLNEVSTGLTSRRGSRFTSTVTSLADKADQRHGPSPAEAVQQNNDIDSNSTYVMGMLRRLHETQNRYGRIYTGCPDDGLFANTHPNPSVDFITNIVDKMALKERILFLAVDLFYLAQRTPALQSAEPILIRLTAIWMAAKFEDAWAPFNNGFFKLESVRELKSRMRDIEGSILEALEFNANLVLVYDFFRFFGRLTDLPPKAIAFGVYCLNSLLTLGSLHCCDKRAIGMSLCRIVAKVFEVTPKWTIRCTGNRLLLALPVDGSVLVPPSVANHPSFASRPKHVCPKPEIVFDLEDLDNTESQLERAIRATLGRCGQAITDRYESELFFRASKVRLTD